MPPYYNLSPFYRPDPIIGGDVAVVIRYLICNAECDQSFLPLHRPFSSRLLYDDKFCFVKFNCLVWCGVVWCCIIHMTSIIDIRDKMYITIFLNVLKLHKRIRNIMFVCLLARVIFHLCIPSHLSLCSSTCLSVYLSSCLRACLLLFSRSLEHVSR